jgi:hypothetical protein
VCKAPEDFFLFIKFAYDLSQPNSGGLEWKLMKQNLCTVEDCIKAFRYLFMLFFLTCFGLCSKIIRQIIHIQHGKSVLALCRYRVHYNIVTACTCTIPVLYSVRIAITGCRSVLISQIACRCIRDISWSAACVIDWSVW